METMQKDNFIEFVSSSCREGLLHGPDNDICQNCARLFVVSQCFDGIQDKDGPASTVQCIHVGCTQLLTDQDIAMQLTQSEYIQYKIWSQQNDPGWKECGGCGQGGVYDGATGKFSCVSCGQLSCFHCMILIGDGHDCAQYQELHANGSLNTLRQLIQEDPFFRSRGTSFEQKFYVCPGCDACFEDSTDCNPIGCKLSIFQRCSIAC